MPVIAGKKYLDDLSKLAVQPSAELALLAIGVHLIIQQPNDSNSKYMRTSLYAMVKSLFALVEASGISSLRTVQSRLLITIYELGHGFVNAAFASLSHCAASAQAMEIHKLCNADGQLHASQSLNVEESRRVWWGIAILDRCVCSPYSDPR